jgi:hypothetical protein
MTMSQTLRATSPVSSDDVLIVATAIMLLTIGSSLVTGLDAAGSQPPPRRPEAASLVLIEAGREWQRQREEQSSHVDPVTAAAREWQQRREQQSSIRERPSDNRD